mgnify:CR=1 FL=1
MDGAAREAKEKIERLKAVRKALGWSEEVCAYHLGVTYSTLNRWERGESLPKSRLVLKAIEHFIARHGKSAEGAPHALLRKAKHAGSIPTKQVMSP